MRFNGHFYFTTVSKRRMVFFIFCSNINSFHYEFKKKKNFLGLAKCIYHSQNKQLIDYYRKLKDVIIRFQRLHVDYTEFACLKALTLFNSGKAVTC